MSDGGGGLACGHPVCEDCRQLAVIDNQPETDAVKFYKIEKNLTGREEATTTGELVLVLTCPRNCDLAEKDDIVTKVPPCPERIKCLLIWERLTSRVAVYRQQGATAEQEAKMYASYRRAEDFENSLASTGVEPISESNTIHIYKPSFLAFNEDNGVDKNKFDKLILLQVRPKMQSASAHALYI